MSRREFLATVGAGSALGAFGEQALAEDKPGEPRLSLPTTSGGATGVKFAPTPSWARETPGWYIPNALSAGSCMLQFPVIPRYQLSSLVKSFRELPQLVTQAKSLGTEAIYLVDWYEPGWENKGDYIPRSDLGGEAALKDGIAAVHAHGGRIIFYVEGWIVSQQSEVGKKHGAQWSVLLPGDTYVNQYPGYWKMCPAAQGWVEYLASVAHRIGQYGADGIFIDSQGWRGDFWRCVAGAHKHPIGGPDVFNNGCVNLATRVRAALQSANPKAIILTEQPTLIRQFEYKDGSLDDGIHDFVTRWLWDAQGHTDTITTSFSLDDWNQILAIGAKLACPGQFLDPPPGSSAREFLESMLKKVRPDDPRALPGIAYAAAWGLHQWRNSGLILGLRMPGFHDVVAKPYRDDNKLRKTLEGLRPRATAIDAAFAGRRPVAPTTHIKSLLTARRTLARFIDHGSSVARVNSGSTHAAAWRFTGANGTALTSINVGNEPCRVVFPNAAGIWIDAVSGERFRTQGGKLTAVVSAHSVRLLHPT
ncbi:MAG TPA: DUF6259 domain-containing protein [Planctomycetaceae bacterium]|nr:DUF6259 domain-containing protein [Planctomycetaceae bacterium]